MQFTWAVTHQVYLYSSPSNPWAGHWIFIFILSILFTFYWGNIFHIIQEILQICSVSVHVVHVSSAVWLTQYVYYRFSDICQKLLVEWFNMGLTNYSMLLQTRSARLRLGDPLSWECRWEIQLLLCFSDCVWHLNILTYSYHSPFGMAFTPLTPWYQEILYPRVEKQNQQDKIASKKAGDECVDLYL